MLKNVRAGIMPPAASPAPPTEELRTLEQWIKYAGLRRSTPSDPDPGRVTLRRLNRVEYRNTIRDLMGVDFQTDEEFPPDDTGYGFDNIGDVLTVSPLLLEKYMQAAETIVSQAVPTTCAGRAARQTIAGAAFRREGGEGEAKTDGATTDDDSHGSRGDVAVRCRSTSRRRLAHAQGRRRRGATS